MKIITSIIWTAFGLLSVITANLAPPAAAQNKVVAAFDQTTVRLEMMEKNSRYRVTKIVNVAIPGGEEDPGWISQCTNSGDMVADASRDAGAWGNLSKSNKIKLIFVKASTLETEKFSIEAAPFLNYLSGNTLANDLKDQSPLNSNYTFVCTGNRLLIKTIITFGSNKQVQFFGFANLTTKAFTFLGASFSSPSMQFQSYTNSIATKVIAPTALTSIFSSYGIETSDFEMLAQATKGRFIDQVFFIDKGFLVSTRNTSDSTIELSVLNTSANPTFTEPCVSRPLKIVGVDRLGKTVAITSDQILVEVESPKLNSASSKALSCKLEIKNKRILAGTISTDGSTYALKEGVPSKISSAKKAIFLMRNGKTIVKIYLPESFSNMYWSIFIDGNIATLIHGPIQSTTAIIQFTI